ncbi:Fic family protein [Candidatus Saccharibacteria bacterium]|nr:Fic family protein [Candidatus Saccharibacteria bacterium]
MKYTPRYTINNKIHANLQEIEDLKDIVRGHQILPAAEASIRLRATVDTVHSSTSIEGNPLNINEVRAVITEDKKISKKEYAEIEVQNYKKAIDYISERKNGTTKLEISDVLELHRIITNRLLDKTRCGHFRHNPVYIEDQDHNLIYEAGPADMVENDVQALLDWVNDNRAIIPVAIIAGVLHYQLVTIHPFTDGNGRTSRALTMLWLSLNNYDCNGTLSLDPYYASDRRTYYEILQKTHGKNYSESMDTDLTSWLEYFTNGFVASLHVLNAEIRILDTMLPKTDSLSREDEDILSYVAKFGAIEISEAEAILPEMNRRSIQRRLKKLVDSGYLELVGATHDAKYIMRRPTS